MSNQRSEGEEGGAKVILNARTVVQIHSMKLRAFSDSTGMCNALSKDKLY